MEQLVGKPQEETLQDVRAGANAMFYVSQISMLSRTGGKKKWAWMRQSHASAL